MYSKHPLQQFLDRQGVKQCELAQALGVTRETVNRWVRRRTVPEGANLLRTLEFARRLEPRIEAWELFPAGTGTLCDSEDDPLAEGSWGKACPVCGIAWDVASEQLPLALLHSDLGDHPIGELCESCARDVAVESDPFPNPEGDHC